MNFKYIISKIKEKFVEELTRIRLIHNYSTKGVTLYDVSFIPEPVRVTSKVRKSFSKSGMISFAHVGATVRSLTLVHFCSVLSISSLAYP